MNATAAARLLDDSLAAALLDLAQGRDGLRRAASAFEHDGDARGALVAHAALVNFIGIADDDYTGLEAAVAAVIAAHDPPGEWAEGEQALLVRAGRLMAGAFSELDDPALLPPWSWLPRRRRGAGR